MAPAGKRSDLVQLRNEFAHEGLFGGEPIGIAHPKNHPNIALELRCFNSRLLLALLGEKDPYVTSPVNLTIRQLIA
jgi:hypothetical protein